MDTTFHFELGNKPTKNGRYIIYLRITQNRKLSRIKTSVSLSSTREWLPKSQKVSSSVPEAKVLNQALMTELAKAQAIYRKLNENDSASLDNIVKAIKGEDYANKQVGLLEYAKRYHSRIRLDGRMGSFQKYGDTINKLEDYLKGKDMPINQVNLGFINDFIDYLKTLTNTRHPKERLHPNTISKHLRNLRAILNDAIKNGKMDVKENPFSAGVQEIKEIPTAKNKLSYEQIVALEKADIPEGSLMWHSRNAFLLSFYCAGIRLGDLIQLRWKDVEGGRLSYQMDKNNKLKNVVLVHQAEAILNKYRRDENKPSDYIFPYLDSKAKYAKASYGESKFTMPTNLKEELFRVVNTREVSINRELRKVASLAGIEQHISFHIARHSFAKQAKVAGVDNEELKGLMNHSSLATTEIYMREVDNSREDDALQKIFGVNPQKESLLAMLKDLDKEELKSLFQAAMSN